MQKAFHAWAQPGFAPFRLDYDADRIDALAKERALEWSRIGSAAFLTVDEQREAAGYGPMGSHAKYSPDQPRVSAGSPEGGRWTSGGGSGGGDLVQVALNTIANVVSDAGRNSDASRWRPDLLVVSRPPCAELSISLSDRESQDEFRDDDHARAVVALCVS